MALKVLQSGLYTCTVKTFCKAPFTCLLGGLGYGVGFRCGYVVFVRLGARWTPVGNIAIDFTSVKF